MITSRTAGDSAMGAAAGFVLTTSIEEVLYVPEKDSSGVALTGSEPDYNPNLWNDPDYIDYNICYAYAVNDSEPIPGRITKPQPGTTMAGSRITAATVGDVRAGAEADGLIYLGNSPSSTMKTPKDHYVVALASVARIKSRLGHTRHLDYGSANHLKPNISKSFIFTS